MKYLLTGFILAILVCLTAAATPRPKPWTFEFHSGWNQACVDALTQVVNRQLGQKADPLKIRNLCDCSSDLIQQKYSQQEVESFGDNPPPAFLKFCQSTVDTCLSDPI